MIGRRLVMRQLALAALAALAAPTDVKRHSESQTTAAAADDALALLQAGYLELKKHLLVWNVACARSRAPLARARCGGDADGTPPFRANSSTSVQLWGERHSGTDAFTHLLRTNFMVESVYPYFYKHMYDGANISSSAAVEAGFRHFLDAPLLARPRVPVAVITREPFQWLLSMHREPHGLEWMRKLSLDEAIPARISAEPRLYLEWMRTLSLDEAIPTWLRHSASRERRPPRVRVPCRRVTVLSG